MALKANLVSGVRFQVSAHPLARKTVKIKKENMPYAGSLLTPDT